MKISATEEHGILLEEIFNAITLRTKDGEELSISMRDSGFEFYYQSKWYFAKEGYVGSFNENNRMNVLVDNNIMDKYDCIEHRARSYNNSKTCLNCKHINTKRCAFPVMVINTIDLSKIKCDYHQYTYTEDVNIPNTYTGANPIIIKETKIK